MHETSCVHGEAWLPLTLPKIEDGQLQDEWMQHFVGMYVKVVYKGMVY